LISAIVEPMTNTNAWLMPTAMPTAPSGITHARTDLKRMPIRTRMMTIVMGSIIIRSFSELACMSDEMAASPVT